MTVKKIPSCNQLSSILLVMISLMMIQTNEASADEGKIGEIRYSILSVKQFKKEYGNGWILMNGSDITGTDLYEVWQQQNIPDARGVYLRGKNHDRDTETGDPRGDRKLGRYLPSEIESHTHADAGHSHGHSLVIETNHGEGGGAAGRGSGGGWKQQGVAGGISVGHANIQATGGDETHPRSIVVNTFIKVNDPNRNKKTQDKNMSAQDIITALEADSKFSKAIENVMIRLMNR